MPGYQTLTEQDYARAADDLARITVRLGGIARLVDRVYGWSQAGAVHSARNALGSLAVMLAERSACDPNLFAPDKKRSPSKADRAAEAAILAALDAS